MSKRTPFYDVHVKYGARLIDFGGFEMPVQYTGILKEHDAVRTAAGMFDVSHMGEIIVSGPVALPLLQFATINDVSKLYPGKAQYSAMCYPDGGIVDDLLVYMLAEQKYMLVVNASNKDKDLEWILKLNEQFGAEISDISENTCLLAVQGPKSIEILQKLTDTDLSSIGFYTFATGKMAGVPDMIISATGYTGEKGFELYFDGSTVSPGAVWEEIMKSGEEHGLMPAGLGARDTLRLEMGYALYGNDISNETTPLEAGLGWVTKLDKGDFCGRDILKAQKESGINRKLIGMVTSDRRAIPRSGYIIKNNNGNDIGRVTSGGTSPMLGKGVGMGYIEINQASAGNQVFIEIRGSVYPAEVQRPPFITK
jgi:aminomethyltransferase